MKNFFTSIFLAMIFYHSFLFAQQVDLKDINPDLLNKRWPSAWIRCAGASGKDYGIYLFRKTFDLQENPKSFIISVSADNRYRLFINGHIVSAGPARGDLQHWRFETVNIAPWLVQGRNVLAAVVWNFGEESPNSQMSLRTAFIVAGNSMAEQMVNTNNTWKAIQDPSYTAITGFAAMLNAYYVVGPGERVEAEKHIWGWEQPAFEDSGWKNASVIDFGQPRAFGTNGDWMLVPRGIPLMEEKELRLKSVRLFKGCELTDNFILGNGPVKIPANSQVSILLDQGYLTTAYPELKIDGGKNAEVKISYAESLFNKDGSKGNRDIVENKEFRGNYDLYIPDGKQNHTYSTLWFRTYRYIQLDIKTQADPMVLKDISGRYTSYPLVEKASFTTDDPRLKKIWDTGWRTARLCAGEIYFDCPYYEQMQYVGDTRIQSLISLYVAGDDRLMKNAIELYDVSRISDGLTQSRYPASSMQIIPPFSLYWVLMVHDYWMLRDDPGYVKSFLPGIESALGWFERRVAQNGILGPLAWWNFVDWADEWEWNPGRGTGGVADGAAEGGSSIITLQFAYALQHAAQIEAAFGNNSEALRYSNLARSLVKNTYDLCWDTNRGLLADTPAKKSFSQHANIFGILTGAFPDAENKNVMEKILNEKSLIQATLFFRFYLVQALNKTGMDNLYLDNLGPWYSMIDIGLSTFAEKLDPTRSDCHAWSASPNYYFLETVSGIRSASPGFKTIIIQPNPGNLKSIEGIIPHPLGNIHVKYEINGLKLKAEVDLPAGLKGEFEWNGVKKELREGRQDIIF